MKSTSFLNNFEVWALVACYKKLFILPVEIFLCIVNNKGTAMFFIGFGQVFAEWFFFSHSSKYFYLFKFNNKNVRKGAKYAQS